MKVTALMSFYDDPPEMIERAIRSVAEIADALVAVDGAYGSFPSGEPQSPPEQAEMIRATAADLDMKLLLWQPADLWSGGEVEKRDFMFRLADTTKADWYTVLDADFVFEFPYKLGAESARIDLRMAAKHGFEVCEGRLIDRVAFEGADHRRKVESNLPLFWRAGDLPPLHIGPTHYHTTREGYETHLWGCGNTPQLPHFDMTDTVHVRHEWWHRSDNRQVRKWTYYHQREQAKLEVSPFAPALDPAEEVASV